MARARTPAVAVPLEQEILSAAANGFQGRDFVVQPGHHDDRHVRGHGIDLSHRFDAPAVRQGKVQQDRVERIALPDAGSPRPSVPRE